jgi:hypothetical protein
MRELTFVGLSDDRLLLSAVDGQEYTVEIDERLATAVRRDRAKLGQLEVAAEGLRPRDIQARIRAGATAEQVAADGGTPVERVRRYEGPVLQERSWIAERAQTVELRRPGHPITLGDLVASKLAAAGVEPDDANWDASRRDDGKWTLVLTYPERGGAVVATWTYDHANRTVTTVDEAARRLSDDVEEDRPRLVGLRSAPEPEVIEIAPVVEVETPRSGVLFEAAPSADVEPTPAPKTRRKRASVPSWDEILFGAKRPED